MSRISYLLSNPWSYIIFFLVLVIIFVILLLTKVIKLDSETTTSRPSSTKKPQHKLSAACQDKKNKSCQGLIENLLKIEKTDPDYQDILQKCLDTKTMNPLGCPTQGRVDFNDYCKAFNKMRGLDSCNKNNKNFYFNTSYFNDFWNQSYNCAKKNPNNLNKYSECIEKLDLTTWFGN